jgi:hypothetical protein
MWDSIKWKDVKPDIKPKHPKSSWVKGPDGSYDGVPRAYLDAKKDSFLCETKNGKSPWPWEK